MNLEDMGTAIIQFVQNHREWAVPIVFVLAFGESLAFVALLVPATFILFGIAGLLHNDGYSVVPIIIAGWLGSALGYAASYWIGLIFKDSIHRVWPFTRRPDLLPGGREFVAKYGMAGVFFGHFFGPLRAAVPTVAGMFAMSHLKFQVANLSSSLIWAIGVLSPAIFGMGNMLKLLIILSVVAGILWIIGHFFQRKLMYFPDRARIPPRDLELTSVEEVTLKTDDGNSLICWYGKAPNPDKPTVLYFHGNAGNLAARSGRVEAYMAEGYGIFMVSYRGYNGSSGSPSEPNNIADAQCALSYLMSIGIPLDKIIIYGESLGTAIAVQLAAKYRSHAVILDSPFTSMTDVALLHYPYLPIRTMLRDRYETMRHIAKISAPKLVLHGEKDTVVPVTMGKAVYKAASDPKKLLTFAEAGHIDHWMHGSYELIFEWLAALPQATPAKEP